jgi:hypothetical protein
MGALTALSQLVGNALVAGVASCLDENSTDPSSVDVKAPCRALPSAWRCAGPRSAREARTFPRRPPP